MTYTFVKELNIRKQCDVLVIGAGPAGVCAALSAARAGSSVCLCERFGSVGGMLTQGYVDPILGSVSIGTLYDEITEELTKGLPEGAVHVTRNGLEIPADAEKAKSILTRKLKEAGVELLLCCAFCDTIVENGRACGAVFAGQSGMFAIRAGITIDCTGDGCAAAAAGADVMIGSETDGAIQPMTLEFKIVGADESLAISAWGGTDPVKIPSGPFAGMEYRELCKMKNAEGELPKNVTIVRLHRTGVPGERSVNATQVNGLNPLDPESFAEAETELRAQIDSCMNFLRKYVPGFENCRLKASATTVGVRESRRIRGIESVTDSDVESGRQRDDAVVHNAWFLIDIHNPRGGGQAEGHSHPALPYDIPYGALVPAGISGMLVAGRCISGTHRAHASYRVMAICMAMGQAAGLAASLCVKNAIEPALLSPGDVRKALTDEGVKL